jgi:hypothetical protein
MRRFGLPEMMIVMSILVFFFAMRKPRYPRKPPKHPLPSHEPLHLFLRIKRSRADSWDF